MAPTSGGRRNLGERVGQVMTSKGKGPSYDGYQPASAKASAAARGSSRKSDTRCEMALRKAIWRLGLRYRKNVAGLPGKPDIVFPGSRLAIFCDGDFWHGRDWIRRRHGISKGTNAGYWIAKIERNRSRDRENTEALKAAGWKVLRYWESEILRDAEAIAEEVAVRLQQLAKERT